LGGLDIKTQVVMDDAKVKKVIVAIPLLADGYTRRVREVTAFVRRLIKGDYNLTVNGTGAYLRHSSIADCGTTGRKLAVDFYGGNCRIGGGSPWTKDGSKADLSLNLVARKLAKGYACKYQRDIVVALGCCIGHKTIDYSVRDTAGTELSGGKFYLSPKDVIRNFKLNSPIYSSMCRWGLFGQYQYDKPWE
jgi:S-adenosylmethionine synthetase